MDVADSGCNSGSIASCGARELEARAASGAGRPASARWAAGSSGARSGQLGISASWSADSMGAMGGRRPIGSTAAARSGGAASESALQPTDSRSKKGEMGREGAAAMSGEVDRAVASAKAGSEYGGGGPAADAVIYISLGMIHISLGLVEAPGRRVCTCRVASCTARVVAARVISVMAGQSSPSHSTSWPCSLANTCGFCSAYSRTAAYRHLAMSGMCAAVDESTGRPAIAHSSWRSVPRGNNSRTCRAEMPRRRGSCCAAAAGDAVAAAGGTIHSKASWWISHSGGLGSSCSSGDNDFHAFAVGRVETRARICCTSSLRRSRTRCRRTGDDSATRPPRCAGGCEAGGATAACCGALAAPALAAEGAAACDRWASAAGSGAEAVRLAGFAATARAYACGSNLAACGGMIRAAVGAIGVSRGRLEGPTDDGGGAAAAAVAARGARAAAAERVAAAVPDGTRSHTPTSRSDARMGTHTVTRSLARRIQSNNTCLEKSFLSVSACHRESGRRRCGMIPN